MPERRTVALVTLGCARNEVDSEELAARLDGDGWELVGDADGADVVVVNTCGFVEKAKRDSIDTLLAAAGSGAKVVATGCMAQRYGRELAASLPVLGAIVGNSRGAIEGADRARLDQLLAGLRDGVLAAEEVQVIRVPGGEVIYSTDRTAVGEFAVGELHYVNARDSAYVHDIYPSPLDGRPRLTIAAPAVVARPASLPRDLLVEVPEQGFPAAFRCFRVGDDLVS